MPVTVKNATSLTLFQQMQKAEGHGREEVIGVLECATCGTYSRMFSMKIGPEKAWGWKMGAEGGYECRPCQDKATAKRVKQSLGQMRRKGVLR